MSTLQNFPMVSQLTTVTGDGKPSENAQLDCLAASIDALCRYLLGKPEDSVFNPDHFKDAAYGDAYRGGTSASAYEAFCKSLGINLHAIDNATPLEAVKEAHVLIQQGKGAIFTENDPYVDTSLPQFAGWTHVCVWFSEDTNGLTALDPYIGKPLYKSDSAWASVLRSNQVWTAERIDEIVTVDLTNPDVAAHFEAVPGNSQQWRCKSNGKIIQYGILSAYQKWGNSALCGLTYLGLPESNEIPLSVSGTVKQFFERGCLVYDPNHAIDNPPGAGQVYAAHLYNGVGQDPALATLEAQIAQLKTQSGNPDALAAIKQAQAIFAPFK